MPFIALTSEVTKKMILMVMTMIMMTDVDGGDDEGRESDVSPRVQTRVRSSTEEIAANFRRVPPLSPDIKVHGRRNFGLSGSCHVRLGHPVFPNQFVCIHMSILIKLFLL